MLDFRCSVSCDDSAPLTRSPSLFVIPLGFGAHDNSMSRSDEIFPLDDSRSYRISLHVDKPENNAALRRGATQALVFIGLFCRVPILTDLCLAQGHHEAQLELFFTLLSQGFAGGGVYHIERIDSLSALPGDPRQLDGGPSFEDGSRYIP